MKKFHLLFLTLMSFNTYSQTVVVSSPYHIDLYQWIENTLTIVVENALCRNIVVKASVGRITQSNCQFTYTIENLPTNDVKISIGIKSKQGIKWIEDRFYKVKTLPLPVIKFMSAQNEKITKAQLNLKPTLFIPDYSFGFEAVESKIYKLDTFSITIVREDSTIFKKANILGNQIPSDIIAFINEKCKNNDLLLFSNFRINILDKENRKSSQILTVKFQAEN